MHCRDPVDTLLLGSLVSNAAYKYHLSITNLMIASDNFIH